MIRRRIVSAADWRGWENPETCYGKVEGRKARRMVLTTCCGKVERFGGVCGHWQRWRSTWGASAIELAPIPSWKICGSIFSALGFSILYVSIYFTQTPLYIYNLTDPDYICSLEETNIWTCTLKFRLLRTFGCYKNSVTYNMDAIWFWLLKKVSLVTFLSFYHVRSLQLSLLPRTLLYASSRNCRHLMLVSCYCFLSSQLF